jgi:hypothetical protein
VPRRRGDFVRAWHISRLLPAQDIAAVAPVRLSDPLGWSAWSPESYWSDVSRFVDRALVNIRSIYANQDGLVYAGNRFNVARTGRWILHLGHDAPARVFVDGQCVLTESRRIESLPMRRSQALVELSAGEHEIVVAFDTDAGRGRGFYFGFEVPSSDRADAERSVFPAAAAVNEGPT